MALNISGYNTPDDQGADGYNVQLGYAHPYVNMFGESFIGAITFCSGGQTTFNSNNINGTITLPEVTIDLCLISVEQDKRIVYTEAIGRDGSIKTVMNNGDFDITISLIVTMADDPTFVGNYNGIYPYSVVKKLYAMYSAPCMIRVTNDYLAMLGVNYVAFTDINLEQTEGSYSQQKLVLNCKSDLAQTYASILSY